MKKIFITFVAFSLVFSPLFASAQVLPEFNPSVLIEDEVFSDTQTFGSAEGIQQFLVNNNSVLADTSPEFLVMLKEPLPIILKQALEDPRPNLPRLRTAAELIWDASLQSGINPQVILVTLQKEQGLITNHQTTGRDQLQKVLDKALGFACPDSGGCGNLFPGFYFQLFGNLDSEGNRYLGAAKSLMKSFSAPQGRGPVVAGKAAQVGETIILGNTTGEPYNAPENQAVLLGNRATAALYRYTPHVFNGNYNFWKYFKEWFKYKEGTILSLLGDEKNYIIQNGARMLLPEFTALSRGLDVSKKIIASPSELSTYPQKGVLGPKDNTVVKVQNNGQIFVFINNIKHPVSEFVLNQRGLNVLGAITVSEPESSLFGTGDVLAPKDGTVLKTSASPAVYLAENNLLKLFSPFTFSQRKIKASEIVEIPPAELDSYKKQGFVAPLEGTLVKSDKSPSVYIIENGFKHPFSGEVFKNRKLSYRNVASLSAEEIGSIPIGTFATPAEITWLKDAGNNRLYLFKDGSLHYISAYVAKTRKITPDYVFTSGEIREWPEGIPYPPRDGTLLSGKTDKTVYLVKNGQLLGLTATAFKNRKLSFKNVVTLPQEEVDAYAKGAVLEK